MRSKVTQRILDRTSPETKAFVRLNAEITVRINQLLREKGISQKDLAEALDKKPSEISKWLKGEHNFTLKSIAKLQAELGEEIICVPKQIVFTDTRGHRTTMIVQRNAKPQIADGSFASYKVNSKNDISHAS
jgi:transcriptional regulator with XRE-family HTH domain